MTYGIFVAMLAVFAGLVYRSRLQRLRDNEATTLSDELIRQIEEDGTIDVDEPLDLSAIQEEEARFWEDERWDEAEEM